MRLINADALERDGWKLHRIIRVDKNTMEYQVKKPTDFHAIEPERKTVEEVEELLCLLPKIESADGQDYVQLSDVLETTHRYAIEPERKKGEWIGTEFDGYADGNPVYYEWKCSSCGCIVEDEEPTWNFCPNCGANLRKEGEQNEIHNRDR